MDRPKIVCLCGSSRFYKQYQIAEYVETMKGNIYLSIGFYPHAAEQMHGEGVGHTKEEKAALDELHKRKIDLADEIFVLNVGGYIGDSTKSEIAYAMNAGKPVRWLEEPKRTCPHAGCCAPYINSPPCALLDDLCKGKEVSDVS